jgi:crossover junction endodeoxyribonuclease RuvC
MVRILGIDPGSLACGYGLIQAGPSPGTWAYLSSGRIMLPPREPLHARLSQLHRNLAEVIGRCDPGEVCIERMFFAKGVKAALNFGHTRGVVLLTASLAGIPIFEYSALEVKKAVTGYGRAEKSQVLEMVKGILGIDHALSSDSADALALALCHGNRSRWDLPSRDSSPPGRPRSTSAVAR